MSHMLYYWCDKCGWGKYGCTCCDACAAKDAEIARLRDALQDLCDAQNGPPLHTKRDIEFWEEAMSKARNLLHNAEGGEE